MFLVLGAVILTTVIICLCAATCSGGKLKFEKTFYFAYYRTSDNAISASSLSEAVENYGGAGYVFYRDGNYFVTYSCYFKEADAKTVISNLKKRDLDCALLKVEIKEYKLQNRNAKKNKELYLGNLNTLSSLSTLAYECANGLDTGEYSQSKAKSILSSITDKLKVLLKKNENNCFTENIKDLLDDCKRSNSGYLRSRDMRYVQIAIIDKILKAELT